MKVSIVVLTLPALAGPAPASSQGHADPLEELRAATRDPEQVDFDAAYAALRTIVPDELLGAEPLLDIADRLETWKEERDWKDPAEVRFYTLADSLIELCWAAVGRRAEAVRELEPIVAAWSTDLGRAARAIEALASHADRDLIESLARLLPEEELAFAIGAYEPIAALNELRAIVDNFQPELARLATTEQKLGYLFLRPCVQVLCSLGIPTEPFAFHPLQNHACLSAQDLWRRAEVHALCRVDPYGVARALRAWRPIPRPREAIGRLGSVGCSSCPTSRTKCGLSWVNDGTAHAIDGTDRDLLMLPCAACLPRSRSRPTRSTTSMRLVGNEGLALR